MEAGMRVLVVGRGGREHALVAALAASGCEVHATRPNPGMALQARAVATDPNDIPGVVAAARGMDLVIVGPEAPLVLGLADALRAAGIPTFGPGADGARLEGSKATTKDFLARHDIPTAMSSTCTNSTEALAVVRRRGAPIVIKADGLAAGKGVVVAQTVTEAEAAIHAFLDEGILGEAGRTILVEECLQGPEVSALAILDGHTLLELDLCRDHKRLLGGDRGPNTGGMGAACPVTLPVELKVRIREQILLPALRGLQRDGVDYRGVLYTGLMLTSQGPKVLEYNVRFGDPEAQVLLPRLGADFARLALAAAEGRLAEVRLLPSQLAAVTVVLAAPGYPEAPRTGDPIHGLQAALAVPDVQVFHAGTTLGDDGVLRTAGGRVLAVTGLGPDVRTARATAYRGAKCIHFEGMQRRDDIAASML
jgi:phosphoribosylamine--glycine ligase